MKSANNMQYVSALLHYMIALPSKRKPADDDDDAAPESSPPTEATVPQDVPSRRYPLRS